MVYDFTKTWQKDRPYLDRDWCYYRNVLNKKYSSTILVGHGGPGGINIIPSHIYSDPISIDASSYNEVCLMIKEEKNGYHLQYDTVSKFEMCHEIIDVFLSFRSNGSFRYVSIDFLYRLCKLYYLVPSVFYCKECSVELVEKKELCWACENGI